ncbi:hypothetical protein F5Y19DRAFT_468838 [Xylariaceae sp. FL1651]|nr:hypothetical protein F5Y19DRAFT_468838 [Xylariaceae sp. FL1651]
MPILNTIFTPSSWCSNRYVVFIDNNAPGTSTIPPSSGWIDPSFTLCIPTQYSVPYPTFSPGVCPSQMSIVDSTFEIHDSRTIWTARCCQRVNDYSGFSPMAIDPQYLCTSAITAPMAFLLDPNITTADIYTTLSPQLWIEHDQVTVQWEPSDLKFFPAKVASQYAFIMGVTGLSSTGNTVPEDTSTAASTAASPAATPAPSISGTTSPTSLPITTTATHPSTSSQEGHVIAADDSQ